MAIIIASSMWHVCSGGWKAKGHAYDDSCFGMNVYSIYKIKQDVVKLSTVCMFRCVTIPATPPLIPPPLQHPELLVCTPSLTCTTTIITPSSSLSHTHTHTFCIFLTPLHSHHRPATLSPSNPSCNLITVVVFQRHRKEHPPLAPL